MADPEKTLKKKVEHENKVNWVHSILSAAALREFSGTFHIHFDRGSVKDIVEEKRSFPPN